jgi:hypothetical protein
MDKHYNKTAHLSQYSVASIESAFAYLQRLLALAQSLSHAPVDFITTNFTPHIPHTTEPQSGNVLFV